MKLTTFLKNHISSLKKLPLGIKIFLSVAFILGFIMRFSDLGNPGFAFDTVETQYVWGRSAIDMGFGDFWKNYTGFLDYQPGSMYLLMLFDAIGRLFGGGAQAFVAVLKSFNWITDIAFVVLLIHVAQKYGKMKDSYAYMLGALLYVLPSPWFVSSIWGQMDSFIVLMSLICTLLLYKSIENVDNAKKLKRFALLSGLVLGIGFWVKMQAILLFPTLILFHLCYRNKKLLGYQFLAFMSLGVLFYVYPMIINPLRSATVAVTPFGRENNISNGAANFWNLLNMHGKGSDLLFSSYGVGPRVDVVGMLVYIGVMFALCVALFKWSKVNRKFPSRFPFDVFALITTVSAIAYYLFLTKMHSRYLHFGLLFSFVAFAAIRTKAHWKMWIALLLIMNFAYFLNQADTFRWWNYAEPGWVIPFMKSFVADTGLIASLGNFVSFIGIAVFTHSYFKEKSKDLNDNI